MYTLFQIRTAIISVNDNLQKQPPEVCSLAQVFSYEFCEISKNTFFTKHAWATAYESDVFFPQRKQILNSLMYQSWHEEKITS